jgi:ribulose kinase
MQIYADVLNCEITVATAEQPVALGAAILGCAAATDTWVRARAPYSLEPNAGVSSLKDLVQRFSQQQSSAAVSGLDLALDAEYPATRILAETPTSLEQKEQALLYKPRPGAAVEYDNLYALYRTLAGNGDFLDVLRRL